MALHTEVNAQLYRSAGGQNQKEFIPSLTGPTCEDIWLEGSQAWKQVEDGHLDQRVLTGLVFQNPPTHLDKVQNDSRWSIQTSGQHWPCTDDLTTQLLSLCMSLQTGCCIKVELPPKFICNALFFLPIMQLGAPPFPMTKWLVLLSNQESKTKLFV